MKQIFYTLLAVSIIFSTCKKEDLVPANTNNNNSSSIEGLWTVNSVVSIEDGYTYTATNSSDIFSLTIPQTFEFFDNGAVNLGFLDEIEIGSWTIDSDTIYILENDLDIFLIAKYEVSSNDLILTYSLGNPGEPDENHMRYVNATRE